MSRMSDLLSNRLGSSADWHAYSQARYPEPDDNEVIKEDPGWTETALTNIFGGIERVTGDMLKGAGAKFNAWDEIGRKGSYSEAVRNSDSTALGDIGRALVSGGDWLNNRANEITRNTSPSEKYANMGLFERLSNPEYLTDPRGAWADTTSGVGTSIPFLLAGGLAPEVAIARGLTADVAGMAAKNAFTRGMVRGANALNKRGLDETLDTMARYGVTGGPLDAFTNASGMYDELKRQGKSDTEINQIINDAFAEELPWDIANMGVTGAVLGGKLFGTRPAATRAGIMGRGLAGIPADATGEYFQEAMQTRLNNKYTGKPYGTWYDPTDEEAAAGAAGFFGGILPGVGGTVRETVRGPEAKIQRSSGYLADDTDGFDSRFFSKWESQPGATDLANVQDDVKAAWNGLASEYGGGLVVTGGAEKGYHAEGENGHEGGWKLDVDKSSVQDRNRFLALCKKYGFEVGDEGDHYDLSGNSNGGVGGQVVATPDFFISDDGGNTAPTTGQREGHTNAWAVHDVFREAGYSDTAIAGILGRLQQEHNFSTEQADERALEDGTIVGGYGMFQWQMDPANGGRGNTFLAWCKENGLNPQDATVQARYALKEATDYGLTPEKMNNLSAEEAADLWTHEFEGGDPGNEKQYANEWLERIKKGGSAVTGTAQNVGKQFADGVIDFAGSDSGFIDQMYQRIVNSLNDEQKSALPGMFDEQGEFINTPENRQALAENEGTAELIRAEAERIAPEYTQSATSKQDVDRLFVPSGGSTMSVPQIEDAIKNDRLTDNEKAAMLQTATDHMNIPRSNLSDNEQAKFVNDLQSAVDNRDFGQIYSLLPNETADAINALRTVPEVAQPVQNAPQAQQGTTIPQAQPTPVQSQPVTSQQSAMSTQEQERRLMELTGQQPANIFLPEQRNQQEPQQEKPGFLKTAQDKVEENADRIRRNRIQQAVQSGDYATAEQLSGITLPRVNAPRSTVNFSERKRQLDAMSLGQLEQVGQQTLTAMQDAGVPVNEDLARDLTAGNTSAIAHAEKKMAEVTPSNGGRGQSVQKKVADFRKQASEVVKQYKDGKIEYQEAFNKLEDLFTKTADAMEDGEAKQEVLLAFAEAVQDLNTIQQEREAQTAKPDYSAMSLDELKAERQKWIDEEVGRWNKNPGGQGTDNGYTYNDRGEINGRYGGSNNPDWYQWAYKRNGNQKPAKRDYPMLADEYLRNTQEYDELVQEIERKEAAETKNEAVVNARGEGNDSSTATTATPTLTRHSGETTASATPSVPQEQQKVEKENSDTNVLKGVEGLWESTIKDYIDRGFGIESYKGHKEGKKLIYDLTFDSEQERQRFIDDFYGESEDIEDVTEEDFKAEEQENVEKENSEKEDSQVAAAEDVNPFGDIDEAFADFAKQAGFEPVKQEKPKAKSKSKAKKKRNMGVKDASKEREEELIKQLKSALNKAHALPMFDPDVVVPAFQLARIYVQRGANSFAEYARDMIDAVGDKVRGWLHPVWEMVENYPDGKEIDESLVLPAFRYVGGFMHTSPQATLDDVRADFAKRAGEDTAKRFDDLLKLAYSGAYNYYNNNTEVTDDELNDSTGENLERDSAGNNQDGVGAVHGSPESSDGRGQGVQPTGEDSRAQRGSGVHGRGSSGSGKAGNSGVQGSAPGGRNRNDSPGGKQLAGSRRDSFDGKAADDGRNAEGIRSLADRPDNGRNRGHKAEAVKVNKNTFKAGDRAQIAGSMPFLMKEQVDDVVKADERLYNKKGEGMMFTNGTGTGKTFTGLGCVERAVQQGKKNILIIAPNDKVQNDWITAGKGFFGLDISKLENTKSAGEGIVITSYENVGANNALLKRDWDMIVSDESHKLMQGEKGNKTQALENVRAMTYHHAGLSERFERLHADEYEKLAELSGKAGKEGLTADEKQEYADLRAKLVKEKAEAMQEWKAIPQENKPKVLFLSATPFSYVPDIEYGEGYLFHYDKSKDGRSGYNKPDGRQDFMIQHFGYRMRYGKLTQPDANVNSDLMEVNFNSWLKEQGVLSGRKLKVAPDYERGYILVDGGIGKQIDEGMKVATEQGVSDSDQKYGKLHSIFQNKLKGNKTRYLLEAIKAKAAVDLIKQYADSGKKVVVFHDFKKNEAENPFVLTDDDFAGMDEVDKATARRQYEDFCRDHPELINLDLKDLQSPIERLTEAFGDSLRIFNGDVPKKKREKAVQEFNDDSSKVNVILCQRASAKEGISMHDTTGKHQRVLIDLGLATRPTDLIQGEGRIYRTGVVTDAIIRYLNTGTDMEKRAFATTIAGRATTAENLSMGEEARALRNAIVDGYMESLDGDAWKKYLPGSPTEGKGGKEKDSKLMEGVSPYEAAKSDYFANQKKTSRNKAQEGVDYYATPEPIGFKMVEWLGLKPGDRVLEPSAGHGAISRYFPAETRNTIVEPSGELATLAKMRLNGGTTSKVVEGRFEDLDIHNKYEGIAMNPPYGVGGKTAYEHVAKAFDHLSDGGRLIAIVPDGPAANKRMESWLYGDGTKANPGQPNAVLLAEIKLPQVTFNRAGTSVATKILVIDKYSDAGDMAKAMTEAKGTIDLTGVKDINELFDKLENRTFPERVGANIPRHFTNTTNNNPKATFKYQALPDSVELTENERLQEIARECKGYTERKGGWFEFRSENQRAKFVRAANRYLAGEDETAAEQQEIVEEVLPAGETLNFKNSTFSEKGETKPAASIKGNLPHKIYDPIKSLAQRHGGQYKKDVRGFVFDDEESRDKFTKEAEALLGEHKYSAEGRAEDLLSDITFTPDSSLTAREKELQAMGERMGVPIVFFEGPKEINGFHSNGISFINREAAMSPSWTFWHETFHWIKNNNPELYNKLVEYVKGTAPFSKQQLDEYRESIGAPAMTDDEVIEEMMADAFPDIRKRLPFFKELAREDRNLYQRLVAWIRDVIDTIRDFFHSNVKGMSMVQVDLMHEKFADMVRDIHGPNSEAIIKVASTSDRTFTLPSGEPLLVKFSATRKETLDNSDNKLYSRIENMNIEARNSRITSSVADKFNKEIQKLVAEGWTDEQINRELNNENSFIRKDVLKPWADLYNQFHAKVIDKKGLLNRIFKDEHACDGETYNKIDTVFNIYKERIERMMDDAGMVYAECAHARRSGQNTVRFHSWRAVEQSIAAHGGTAQFKEQPIKFSARKHSDNQGAFSDAKLSRSVVNPPGSIERIRNALMKLVGGPHMESNVEDRHSAKMAKKDSLDDTIPLTSWMHSMKYLAGKNEAIKRMYYLGKRCMDEQEHLRNEFGEVIRKINKLMEDKEERERLQSLLWAGDAEGREYTEAELKEAGFSDNVISAYKLVRENLAGAYNIVNEARMQVKVRNKTIKASELQTFMKENFVGQKDIVNTQHVGDGKIILTYKGPKVYTNKSQIVDEDTLKSMEGNENIFITDKQKTGEGVYSITYNERPQPMGKLTGYMPHFFHRFMVYEKRTDKDGNEIKVSMGSADSLAGAAEIANKLAQKNPDKNFVIDTHGFTYGDENNGVVIGDLNYEAMTKQLAANTEMNLKEANEFLHAKAGASLKSRHRFFGNMMKRTGAEGFDQNMMWALKHYFNSAARYVAMEHFKPDAISWYERFFGDFNADPDTIKGENKRKTARIIRDYIMDVNGNPRWLEKELNKIIDNIPVLGQMAHDYYNGRPALAISSGISGSMAIAKLGLLNPASAMLNFMQLINIATMLNSYKYAWMGFSKALKPSEFDQKILDRSHIMDEINQGSDAGGYTQTRDYGGVRKGLGKLKWALNKSMFLFNKADALMRKTAILGAYYQGVQEKGMKPDRGQEISAKALEYAREVNSEANFDYSAANTPEMIRMGSVVTQQLFQFQKYPIMQYEFFLKHVLDGTNAQRVKFLLPYFLLTGLPGMVPFGELLNTFLLTFFSGLLPGDDGEDDFAKKMKAEMMRWAGNDSAKQAIVNSVTNGPLAAFTGIDISQRAGMQNFFAGQYYGGEKPNSAWDAVGHALGGAAYSTVTGVQRNWGDSIIPMNPWETIKAVSPALGNFAQAWVGETRTTHHRVGSTYNSMYERILHGMGFRHIDETNTQFINSYLYESSQRQKEDKKYVMDAYLDDPSPENREQLVLWGISDKALENYAKSREQSSKDRAAGQEKKSKKPRTEAQQRDDSLREWFK